MNRHKHVEDNWLKSAREKVGLSVLELAVKSGVNPRTIERIEGNGQRPHPGTLHLLAQALDVSVDDLREAA